MRLTNTPIDIILKATSQNFGEDALVWLFGSRVDDRECRKVVVSAMGVSNHRILSAKIN